MLHIEITEIKNGFTVYLFNSDGPEELDKTVFYETFKETLEKISEWKKSEDKKAKLVQNTNGEGKG